MIITTLLSQNNITAFFLGTNDFIITLCLLGCLACMDAYLDCVIISNVMEQLPLKIE